MEQTTQSAMRSVLISLRGLFEDGDRILDLIPQSRGGAFAGGIIEQTGATVLVIRGETKNGSPLGPSAEHVERLIVLPTLTELASNANPPLRLARVEAGAALRETLMWLSPLLPERQGLVWVEIRSPSLLADTIAVLADFGFVPRVHLEDAFSVLFSRKNAPFVAHFPRSSEDAVTNDLNERWSAQATHAVICDLRDEVQFHARRTNTILDEQLLHTRRVEAELFEITRRPGQGPFANSSGRPASPSRSQSTTYRKMRKLVQNPSAFFQDAKHPLLKAVLRLPRNRKG